MNGILAAALGADVASASLTVIFLVFLRTGTALMLLPGFSDAQVPTRFRLGLAVILSVILALSLGARAPSVPTDPGSFVLLFVSEMSIGLAIGFTARLGIAVLSFAGALMAMQSGLAAAAFFDPQDTSQRTVFTSFLSMAAVTLLFVGDGQRWLLGGLAASYDLLPAGMPLPLDDMMQLLLRLGGDIFRIGLQIAAPLVAVSLVTNLALGLLNRMMPSLQVLSVAISAQLLVGLAATAVAMGSALLLTLSQIEHSVAWLVPPLP